jgi:hypothetical protein
MGASVWQWALAPVTGGASLLPEDTRSDIPIIGPLTGAKSDEQKALEATQRRLAEEQKQRMEQQKQAHLQNMANRLMAFAPMNNHLASRLGPQAAFTPQQMSQLAADPSGGPQAPADVQRWLALSDEERHHIRQASQRGQKTIVDNSGFHWQNQNIADLDARGAAFHKAQQPEQARQSMVEAAFSGMPAGPQPIPISAPAPPRRY